ncbi:hypothetical protein CC80DRAFT_596777 [Byssothecium circinans]|uniref:non-specific serine/threonine protein kinase n=1 Tax=Byssothecium circinans TaxID=147558 RepID=A0A6A5TJ19_9PLEO|nr:hypothetical protein CC80DRAFT_596777 [Byssothecium circinans]
MFGRLFSSAVHLSKAGPCVSLDEARELVPKIPSEHVKPSLDDEYEVIEVLIRPNGSIRAGISIVKHIVSGINLICKSIEPGLGICEARFHADLVCHPHIAQIHNFVAAPQVAIGNEQKHYDQLYMEYCERGTVQKVTRWYHNHDMIIPELFIWNVLESLARALCFMHLGLHTIYPSPYGLQKYHKDPTWNSIIHKDLHPGNVFLTDNPPPGMFDYYSLYPRVILGDFGCSRYFSSIQRTSLSSFEEEAWKDIEALGRVIWSMAFKISVTGLPVRGESLSRKLDERWVYSRALKQVLIACLERNESQLMSADVLLGMVVRKREGPD